MKHLTVIIFLMSLVLLGAGCQRGGSLLGLGTQNKPAQKDVAVDFCAKHKNDAMSAIQKFKLKPEYQLPFDVWKKAFIQYNAIDEKYFNEHVLVADVWDLSTKVGPGIFYNIRYYLKFGDIYLRTDGDMVEADWGSLDNFKKQTVETLLKNPLPANNEGKFNEPHPTFGTVSKFGITRYGWGRVKLTKISNTQLTSLDCRELIGLLKSCQADIKPEMIAYKPALDRAWLTGSSRNSSNQRSKNKDCAEASVELFGKKLDSCSKGISCSSVIFN